MVIFHSYVKLPEGNGCEWQIDATKTLLSARPPWDRRPQSWAPRSRGRPRRPTSSTDLGDGMTKWLWELKPIIMFPSFSHRNSHHFPIEIPIIFP